MSPNIPSSSHLILLFVLYFLLLTVTSATPVTPSVESTNYVEHRMCCSYHDQSVGKQNKDRLKRDTEIFTVIYLSINLNITH